MTVSRVVSRAEGRQHVVVRSSSSRLGSIAWMADITTFTLSAGLGAGAGAISGFTNSSSSGKTPSPLRTHSFHLSALSSLAAGSSLQFSHFKAPKSSLGPGGSWGAPHPSRWSPACQSQL